MLKGLPGARGQQRRVAITPVPVPVPSSRPATHSLAQAEARFTWQATLDALPASATPFSILLGSAPPMRTVHANLTDVLVGTVLLVSGQSNVGISVVYSNQFNQSAEAENEAAAARLGPTVRLRAVPQCGRASAVCPNASAPSSEFGTAPDCEMPSKQCGTLSWARASALNVVRRPPFVPPWRPHGVSRAVAVVCSAPTRPTRPTRPAVSWLCSPPGQLHAEPTRA